MKLIAFVRVDNGEPIYLNPELVEAVFAGTRGGVKVEFQSKYAEVIGTVEEVARKLEVQIDD